MEMLEGFFSLANVSTSTLSPSDDPVYPIWVGYLAVGISVIFFGSNFVPAAKYPIGDGLFVSILSLLWNLDHWSSGESNPWQSSILPVGVDRRSSLDDGECSFCLRHSHQWTRHVDVVVVHFQSLHG